MTIHKAAPAGADAYRCAVCGQRIKQVPGGHGTTYVHADSGAVAAPNPPVGRAEISPVERGKRTLQNHIRLIAVIGRHLSPGEAKDRMAVREAEARAALKAHLEANP